MISIRDLINEVCNNHKGSMTRITDYSLGKLAYFGSE